MLPFSRHPDGSPSSLGDKDPIVGRLFMFAEKERDSCVSQGLPENVGLKRGLSHMDLCPALKMGSLSIHGSPLAPRTLVW